MITRFTSITGNFTSITGNKDTDVIVLTKLNQGDFLNFMLKKNLFNFKINILINFLIMKLYGKKDYLNIMENFIQNIIKLGKIYISI
jgi:hypothetical protein